jgi:hypothetical protein
MWISSGQITGSNILKAALAAVTVFGKITAKQINI